MQTKKSKNIDKKQFFGYNYINSYIRCNRRARGEQENRQAGHYKKIILNSDDNLTYPFSQPLNFSVNFKKSLDKCLE
jgi:hypothetical protein